LFKVQHLTLLLIFGEPKMEEEASPLYPTIAF